jgi:hypothetical protein
LGSGGHSGPVQRRALPTRLMIKRCMDRTNNCWEASKA